MRHTRSPLRPRRKRAVCRASVLRCLRPAAWRAGVLLGSPASPRSAAISASRCVGLNHADRTCETRGLVRKQRALQAQPSGQGLRIQTLRDKGEAVSTDKAGRGSHADKQRLRVMGLSPEPTGRGVLRPTRAHLLIC